MQHPHDTATTDNCQKESLCVQQISSFSTRYLNKHAKAFRMSTSQSLNGIPASTNAFATSAFESGQKKTDNLRKLARYLHTSRDHTESLRLSPRVARSTLTKTKDKQFPVFSRNCRALGINLDIKLCNFSLDFLFLSSSFPQS